jgi:hypothetical protein
VAVAICSRYWLQQMNGLVVFRFWSVLFALIRFRIIGFMADMEGEIFIW